MKKWVSILLALLLLVSCTACGGGSSKASYYQLDWPTSELVNRLPLPESTLGEINSESDSYFSVDIGNCTKEQYNAYVSACQDAGFTVDYSKGSTSFSGYDPDGYYIWVYYSESYGEMSITIREPEEENDDVTKKTEKKTTTATKTEKKTTTTTTEAEASDDIGADFKAAMDAYEAFMDEYVAFMKKYQANPSDLTLLSDYATFMSDYAEYCETFAQWEDEELNTAELAYYMEVQSRVTQKLLEVAE